MKEDIFIEPPNYYIENHIFDFQFSPREDALGLVTAQGELQLVKYDQQQTEMAGQWSPLGQVSGRAVSFLTNGLIAGYQNGSLGQVDFGSGLTQAIKVDEAPIYCQAVLGDFIIGTGHDQGGVNIIDLRTHKKELTLTPHNQTVTQIALSND